MAASEKPHILIADDQRDVREALRLLLKSEGWNCTAVEGPREALDAAQKKHFDVALIDLNYTRDTTSGAEGLELLRELKTVDEELPVVVMTAWGTINMAVEAMRHGAGDFIEKPWDNPRLMSVLGNQRALGRARRRGQRLQAENTLLRGPAAEGFVAEAPSMRRLLERLARVAPSSANVLILGENGTGKGVIARLLHDASRRADASFVKVNMGGIPQSVFEAEMFGHVRGAFTDAKSDRIGRFELADGGSLFLDEIANIPLAQQPKLLRVLEDGELERVGSSRTLKVDVRLISATNADLPAEVANGTFRKDLLFRLNTVELHLPPLRERGEDIPLLAESFLDRFGKRYQREGMRFSPSALNALCAYTWPGNVRELSHAIERAVLMAVGDVLDASALNLASGAVAVGAGAMASPSANGQVTVEEAEKQLVRQALEKTGGNIQRAAALLGLSRPALYRRMEKYGIE
ncbi:MAG: sigma-54-dependent Fis family transcriptional regulator [Xanthomonadales bacterium]|uniref:sigma-54-dependent transcriptional regulator n=1 Tax=Dokdonella sp. TaxID=2291710 RepID=UPI002B7E7DBB|nr:sigma-54-dependent Fis family transcriptional regulator [Xanthomonadales bacterium]HQW76205.1 sigma-54 dependent transcriptional regulator [Dokdonella sp.]MBK7013881.1 sigma-54-dependent Fis family transcriptional regulator [Xanthomonadales bacterium]MBK7209365.1 sigma-54-dependent Fis family transcriptional regulator [Xanthomonadales bacterium]MBL0223423.1 sigma-54-dependent Fis family transcriptional regulator [Xanthomonadales bacterium]